MVYLTGGYFHEEITPQIDSVVVVIDSLLKTENNSLFDGYSFSIVKFHHVMISTGPISYNYLCGKRLLNFTDDMSDYLSMLPEPAVCFDPEEFYITDENHIIHEKYKGVSVSLEMFISELSTSTIRQNRTGLKSRSGSIQLHPNNRVEYFSANLNVDSSLEITAFNLSGKKAGQWVAQQRDGKASLIINNRLAGGFYFLQFKDIHSGNNQVFRIFLSP